MTPAIVCCARLYQIGQRRPTRPAGQRSHPFVPAQALGDAHTSTATKRTVAGTALRLRFVARPLLSPPPASDCERWGGVRGGGIVLANAVPEHTAPPPGASPSAPRHRLIREMCACPSAQADLNREASVFGPWVPLPRCLNAALNRSLGPKLNPR